MADELQASHETLERRVEERTTEIRRLLKERTDFFAGISHELKTPIAVILNQAKMLLTSIKGNGKRGNAERIEMILQSADQLLARVRDILELARAESGRIEVSLSDVAVPELLGEIRTTIRGLASAGRHTVDIELPGELPLVRADPTRLKDVVMNLVDNAVKYMPAGGTIGVAVEARNGRVELSVSDSGPGIPEEVGNRIFEPFYRVPGIRPQRGQAATGLGLALTKRLVEAQGGKIRFESARGRGATFIVSLRPSRSRSRKT
jgi:signal transduction histidine kinase